MSKVRWGLLSTANINRRVIPAIRASEAGELVAVASRSEAKVQAYAAQWEIPQTFSSYEAMLASDRVDVVYIGLPNHLHVEWTIKALRAGKHVLCEKPFALTVADVERVMAVAEETDLAVAEAFMYRHHPQTKLVGEWVHNGRLGDITLFRGSFDFAMRNPEGNVRLEPEYGGGCLWDVGCYPMSLAQFVMGEAPESVFGEQWIGPSGVDEMFAGQLRYGNGRIAQIASSFRTPFNTYAEIVGTKGRLWLNRPFTGLDEGGRQLLFHSLTGEVETVTVPEKMLYLGEIEDMHGVILRGERPYISLSETRDHIRTLLALYESAQRGERVQL